MLSSPFRSLSVQNWCKRSELLVSYIKNVPYSITTLSGGSSGGLASCPERKGEGRHSSMGHRRHWRAPPSRPPFVAQNGKGSAAPLALRGSRLRRCAQLPRLGSGLHGQHDRQHRTLWDSLGTSQRGRSVGRRRRISGV